MDEPPEVKHFLQELGEGGRAAPEPGLPGDGLPAGGASLPSRGTQPISRVLFHYHQEHPPKTKTVMHLHDDEEPHLAGEVGMHVREQPMAATQDNPGGGCHIYDAHGSGAECLPACMRATAQCRLLLAWVHYSGP